MQISNINYANDMLLLINRFTALISRCSGKYEDLYMFHGSELTTALKINKYASILTLIQTVMIF